MSDPIAVDPNLKALIEANSAAVAALIIKVASTNPEAAEEIAHVTATDADVRAAIAGAPESIEPPAASPD